MKRLCYILTGAALGVSMLAFVFNVAPNFVDPGVPPTPMSVTIH